MMGGLFSSGGTPDLPPAPVVPSEKEAAQKAAAEMYELNKKKRGRAANILTGSTAGGDTSTAVAQAQDIIAKKKVLLGE